MPFEVMETEQFTLLFETLEPAEKEWIRKIIRQLETNIHTGKSLGPEWFREKKYEGKRLYFIIYPANEKALLVAFGPKKRQQEIIDLVRKNIDVYRKTIEE